MKVVEKTKNNISTLLIGVDEPKMNLIKAQQEIIVSFQHPELLISNFDLIFDYIHEAIEMSENINERKVIVNKASYMIYAIAFLFQAKYLYEILNRSEDCKKLIANGFDMISKSFSSLTVNSSHSELFINSNELMKSVFVNEYSFMNKFPFFYNNKKEIEKQRLNYTKFFDKLMPKLRRSYDLFGKHYLVNELVINNRGDFIKHKYPSFTFQMKYTIILICLLTVNIFVWIIWLIVTFLYGIDFFYNLH